MKPLAARAYEAGVQDVLELARRVAKGLEGSSIKPTRLPFAVAGLLEFADAAETLLIGSSTETKLSIVPLDEATIARTKGYTGEACPDCANFTLVRNGTCLKCDTCGSTTGCS